MALPLSLRLILVFAVGVCLGSLVNLAVYRLAYFRRAIGAWGRPHPDAPPRRWLDRLPIVGWLWQRREAPIHGRGFWVRPILVELAVGGGLAWLYWWEVAESRLVVGQLARFEPGLIAGPVAIPADVLHAIYFSHVVLVVLMAIASLIDIDEQTIPDAVTVPGTIFGLVLATLWPWSLLPVIDPRLVVPLFGELLVDGNGAAIVSAWGERFYLRFLTMASPNDWPGVLGGAPRMGPLTLALGCYWLWCFALLPRTWYGRHGVRRALAVFSARLFRSLLSRQTQLLILGGSGWIVAVWASGSAAWTGLLTALVGLVGGGSIVWAVRLIGAATLRKEAMGFGDVTLMMMIGTFVGWQPCIVIFFIAPFAALVLGLVRWIVLRDKVVPYGPFLCVATVVVLVRWVEVWGFARELFTAGWLVPAGFGVSMVLMALMLGCLRLVQRLFRSPNEK